MSDILVARLLEQIDSAVAGEERWKKTAQDIFLKSAKMAGEVTKWKNKAETVESKAAKWDALVAIFEKNPYAKISFVKQQIWNEFTKQYEDSDDT